MNSYISWIGGKKLLRNKIIEQFPNAKEYNRYIEVFGGAGWILFAKDRHADLEVFNDANGELINLYRCVKYHCEELQKELEWSFISREQFFDAKEQIASKSLTDIQRAAKFFLLIKNSFGCDLRSFGMRPRKLDNSIEFLSKAKERLNQTIIENKDFENLIRVYDREKALFYIDPPYYKTEKYYDVNFTAKDHLRLKDTLDEIKGKFILSYNDSEYIRELYKKYKIIEVERQNNLVCKACEKYKELIIKNF